jgi:hypothetical protein
LVTFAQIGAEMKDYVPLLQSALWVLLFLLMLLFFGPQIKERLRAGGALKIGVFELGELRRDLDRVQDRVDDLGEKVAALFLATMSEGMYLNLKKIASGWFGEFRKSSGLERELRFLRDYGFIEIQSIGALPDEGPELCQYASVTEAGRRFVDLAEAQGRGH